MTVTGSGAGTTVANGVSVQWQYSLSASITATRMTGQTTGSWWAANVTGSGSYSVDTTATDGRCTETRAFRSGALDNLNPMELMLAPPNGYVFFGGGTWTHGNEHVTESGGTDCGHSSYDVPWIAPVSLNPSGQSISGTLPATGFSLTGSRSVQAAPWVFVGPQSINETVQWDFEPDCSASSAAAKNGIATATTGCVPPEVVVPMTPEFANWRPMAGADGTRGNTLTLRATLQATGGGATTLRAISFKWEFTEVSTIKGYAMNAPLTNQDTGPDLKFDAASGLVVPPDGQSATTVDGSYTESTVTLVSYDWGAFGKVKVTAILIDGSPLVGYLEGDSAQTEIRVPRRSATSQIADVWKEANNATGLADTDDSESVPFGDGTRGDGLTLYEEYRGFIIDGEHQEGDPVKKDFFIENTASCSFLAGIKMFESLSGLKVHYNHTQSFLGADRVINTNYDRNTHYVDQHGILIVPILASPRYFRAAGGPGNPRMIEWIEVGELMPGAPPEQIAYFASSLAHELLHSCNVYHHGDVPDPTVTWIRQNTVIENGTTPVTLLDETGASVADRLPIGVPVSRTLGIQRDSHSGNDTCVMRYDDVLWYRSIASSDTVRYHVDPPEPAGTTICASPLGTGVNSPHSPQSRYGDAAPGRGNCKGQILVNDFLTAPRR